ncbi:DNA-methyltransferase [Anatilimnocola floriformis]|uniref:DNA-methyltransferase n=1 Tax=Anatilimnocola floriformis TaxID=2948575 RepID=UPI0020C45BB1|nr:site-specific DNA-methyltransferase [Anatilimnocola floriformis]
MVALSPKSIERRNPLNQSDRAELPAGVDLRHGDCFQLLADVPDASVDTFITDPPYGSTDCRWDHKIDLVAFWQQTWRVLKPAGVVAVFAAQPFATDVVVSARKYFRYELVWLKARKVGFFNANRQPLRQHELLLIFCRRPSLSTYNPQFTSGKPYKGGVRKQTQIYGQSKHNQIADNAGTRHPTSVLQMNDFGPRIHPTQKPNDLCRWLVRTYSQPGDLVVDPFSGSGSTAEACAAEGRRFLGFERDPDIYATARHRLATFPGTR